MRKGNKHFFNTIDWYIVRKIFATLLVAMLLINFIIIILDLSTRLDDFIEHNAPLKAVIFDYYFNLIPHYSHMFGYLFFFISVVFVTSQMTSRSETVAVLCSGISFNRMLRPFIVSSIAVGIFGLYLSNFLIPQANIKIYNFEQLYYRNKFTNNFIDIHIQTGDSTQVYVHHFDNRKSNGFLFTKETFHNGHITEKIAADKITYDSVTKKWTMTDYSVRKVDGKQENLTFGYNQEIDLNGLEPNDFNKILKVDQLNFNQLNKTIDRERMKGTSKVRDLQIEKYSRLLHPIAYVILTLIAVSLSCKKTRGGTGINLAVGIALAFSLILMMKIFNVWATNGTLPPLLAPLIPLVIYAVIAVYLWKKAPK